MTSTTYPPPRPLQWEAWYKEHIEVVQKISDQLEKYMKRSDKLEKRYICPEDLNEVWRDIDIRAVILDKISDEEAQQALHDMKAILSCLIFSRARESLWRFRQKFWNRTGPRFTDANIPVRKEQLDFLSPEHLLQDYFYRNQFVFKPIIIETTSKSSLQRIENPLARLPFETVDTGIGEGGYGTVDRVAISAHHIRNENGSDWHGSYIVAVKKPRSPDRRANINVESARLKVLKESSRTHRNIVFHLAIVEHGLKCYIILPYAQWGDLETFLLRGYDAADHPSYDFRKRFPCSDADLALSMFKQCAQVADALGWLHYDVTTDEGDKISFIHMDLKPDNILIDRDDTSSVGVWKIADFGISVLDATSGAGSVRDYEASRTMIAAPQRHMGVYQAPEVAEFALAHGDLHTPRSSKRHQGIGRKSDVWSFTCIFSEILAFALDPQGEELKKFRESRRDGKGDWFVEKLSESQHGDTLGLSGHTSPSYQIRRSVIQQLDIIARDSRSPHQWVQCYVGTIKKLFIADRSKRPNSKKLHVLVKHVQDHVTLSKENKAIECELLQTNRNSRQHSQHDMPTTFSEPDSTSDNGTTAIRDHTIPDVTVTCHESSEEGCSQHDEAESSPRALSPRLIHNSKRRSLRQLIPHGRSLAIRPEIIHRTQELTDPHGRRFQAMAISSNLPDHEISAAYLLKDYSILLFKLDETTNEVHSRGGLALSNGIRWKGLALSGYYLAAWGSCPESEKRLWVRNLQSPQKRISVFETHPLDLLKHVALSPRGIIALMFSEKIIVSGLDLDATEYPLNAGPGRHFTSIAFNDSGNLLFAWAYGPTDALYVYRFHKPDGKPVAEAESCYERDLEKTGQVTQVLPFNTQNECIIAPPTKYYFPARIQGSIPRVGHCHTRDNSYYIGGISKIHAYLYEYTIKPRGVEGFERGTNIARLRYVPSKDSTLRAVQLQSHVILAIFDVDGRVSVLKFPLKSSTSPRSSSET